MSVLCPGDQQTLIATIQMLPMHSQDFATPHSRLKSTPHNLEHKRISELLSSLNQFIPLSLSQSPFPLGVCVEQPKAGDRILPNWDAPLCAGDFKQIVDRRQYPFQAIGLNGLQPFITIRHERLRCDFR